MRTEDFIHNDTEHIALRKYQNNLIIVGTGVIALAVWDAIKTVMLPAAVIAGGLFYGNTTLAAYIYGAGLIYSAVLRIISAFRRTDIVYIQ